MTFEDICLCIEEILHIKYITDSGRINPPCATVDIYNERGILFGDGIAEEEQQSVQIDLWYSNKKELIHAKQILKKALKAVGINTNIEIFYDAVAKLHRATFHFIILFEGEESRYDESKQD